MATEPPVIDVEINVSTEIEKPVEVTTRKSSEALVDKTEKSIMHSETSIDKLAVESIRKPTEGQEQK